MAASIRDAAAELFAQKGWHGTAMAEVARRAGVSAGTAYVYFPSKFALLLAVYEPWLREGVEALRRSVRLARTPETRLRRLVVGLILDLPRDRGGFAATVMAAIGGVQPGEYHPELGRWLEEEVASLIGDSLGLGSNSLRRGQARLLLLAFDGAALRARFANSNEDELAVDALVRMLLDDVPPGHAP